MHVADRTTHCPRLENGFLYEHDSKTIPFYTSCHVVAEYRYTVGTQFAQYALLYHILCAVSAKSDPGKVGYFRSCTHLEIFS